MASHPLPKVAIFQGLEKVTWPGSMPPMTADRDTRVRLAAFEFLEEQTAIHGEVLPRSLLEKGFTFEGERVPLISPQGIFTPRVLEIPLTFCTVPPTLRNVRPYEDEMGEDGSILYKYRGIDPQHRDNVGLRRAMREKVPLIYLYGLVPGQYRPVWPAYIVEDNPQRLTFRVLVEDQPAAVLSGRVRDPKSDFDRRYATIETQVRLHQQSFRLRVLNAYHESCAICRLRHPELLEAAHILPDKHPEGQPVIPNGIAFCKLHHAAYDGNIIGIRPDYHLEVRRDVLEEEDGPMLRQGLQAVNGQRLHIPRPADFRPDKHRLEIRYEQFRKAS